MLRAVQATRYVTPLREGGSLPGLVEADDDGMYVVKFSGAGQGTAALVAEVVVGELGRRLGVRVPELVRLELDPEIGRREPDEEVQDLLAKSPGVNLGMDYLPGSLGYDGIGLRPDPAEAALILWLDAYTANIDRTWRNPNLLWWHRRLWAIDHGAALVFHHAWAPVEAWAVRRYDLGDHVLAPVVSTLPAAVLGDLDAHLADRVTPDLLAEVLALVPDEWLSGMNSVRTMRGEADPGSDAPDAERWRARYVDYLLARRRGPRPWRTGPLEGIGA